MTRRNIMLAAVAILVVAGGITMLVVWRADQLVKRAIEQYGSAATQTAVAVEHVDIRLGSTSAGLRALTVANPPGFSAAPAMRLNEVRVALDPASIGTNVVVLNEVNVTAPHIMFEVDANRHANIDVIRRNVEQYGQTPTDVGTSPSAIATPAGVAKEPWRVVIKKLSITGGHLEIDATALGGKRKVVDLPDSELSGIGEDSGGATGPELAQAIAMALVRDVATTVAATQVETKIEEAFGGKAGKAIGKGVGDVIKSLGGLMNDVSQP